MLVFVILFPAWRRAMAIALRIPPWRRRRRRRWCATSSRHAVALPPPEFYKRFS